MKNKEASRNKQRKEDSKNEREKTREKRKRKIKKYEHITKIEISDVGFWKASSESTQVLLSHQSKKCEQLSNHWYCFIDLIFQHINIWLFKAKSCFT